MTDKNSKIKKCFRIGIALTTHPVLCSRRLSYNFQRFTSARLSSLGYYKYPYRFIFIVGMAIGGTTWMKNLVARIPGYYTYPTPIPKDVDYQCDYVDSAFSRIPKHGYVLFKTHLRPTQENLDCLLRNGVEKILITHRDLRDVAVSCYYRLVNFPKSKDAYDFVDYRMMGKENAMSHSIEITGSYYVRWIRGWQEIAKQDPERYHFTKFEDLKKDTEGAFKKVLHFYGIELSDKKIKEIVEASKGKGNMKKNIAESRILPWGYSSNFRSGKIGNWKNELTDAQIKKCKDLLGSTLIEFGYEKDLNW